MTTDKSAALNHPPSRPEATKCYLLPAQFRDELLNYFGQQPFALVEKAVGLLRGLREHTAAEDTRDVLAPDSKAQSE